MEQADAAGMERSGTVPRQGPRPVLSERIFASVPIPPPALGAALALASVLALLALSWATGDLVALAAEEGSWWQNRDARIALLLSLLAVAVLTALRYHAVGTRQDLAAVARLGGWRIEDIDPARAPGDARRTRVAAVAGALVLPMVALMVDRDPGVYFAEGYWFFSKAWTWVLGSLATCGGGVLVYRATRDARHFSRLAEQLPHIDLLDLAALAPFASQALRAAVPGLLGLSFVALNALDQGFAWAIGVVGSISLVGGALILAIPLRGLRARIQRAKHEELSRLNAAIRGEPGALAGSPIGSREALGLSDLLAWRREVASIPEWVLDPTTLGRYGLYLAIPLASWVGGALVDRVLDLVLG